MTTTPGGIREAWTPGMAAEVFAILTALAYVMGFIVVSANLSSFGVQAFQAFRLQYILAGAFLFLILAGFAYLVGRRLYRIEDRITSVRLEFAYQLGGLWARLAPAFLVSEIAFNIVVASLLLGPFLFETERTRTDALVFTFFIADYILISGRIRNLTDLKARLGSMLVLQVLSVPLFLRNVQDPQVRALFWGFVTLTIAIAALVHFRALFRETQIYLAVATFVTALVWSGYFGATLYKYTRASIGGGKPVVARLVLTDEAREVLGEVISVEGNLSEQVLILADSGDELLVTPATTADRKSPILRISKTLVRGSVVNR